MVPRWGVGLPGLDAGASAGEGGETGATALRGPERAVLWGVWSHWVVLKFGAVFSEKPEWGSLCV